MSDKNKLALILKLIEQYWDWASDADAGSMQLICDIELIARYKDDEPCCQCACGGND